MGGVSWCVPANVGMHDGGYQDSDIAPFRIFLARRERMNTDRWLRRSIFPSTAMPLSCSARRASSFRWCAGSASIPSSAISVAGAILGPLGLGSFIGEFPLLYWFTVVDAKNVAGIADLGIVFLLFLIGMELSYERLKTMRRLVFGLGSLQIALSAAAIGCRRDAGGRQAAGAAHRRCLPGAVVDGHRRRGAFQAGTAEHHRRPRQFRDPAGAGSGGGAACCCSSPFSAPAIPVRWPAPSCWRSATPASRSA